MNKIYPVCVIGGGSAGTMAVIRTVLNNDETLFFEGDAKNKKQSRAFWVAKVENMPAHLNYKKGIVEPNKESLEWLANGEFTEKLHWKKNTGVVDLKKNSEDLFEITASDGNTYLAKFVILATGVMDVQPIINGSMKPILPYANVQLADYCLRCDGHHVLGKKVAVFGHNSSALWVAIMLYERYNNPEMYLITNGKQMEYDDETKKLQMLYGIKVIEEEVLSITGNAKENKLEGLVFKNDLKIETEIIFISLGMIVYNDLALKLQANVDNRGFVLTDAKGKTNVPGLYVAGDLRANAKKQIYTAWDHAVDSADEINVLLRREKRQKKLAVNL